MFTSTFEMNQEVTFQPRFIQAQEMGIAEEPMDGTIVAVKFTEAKVFYSILSPYWGKIFEDVPSEKVWKYSLVEMTPEESNI